MKFFHIAIGFAGAPADLSKIQEAFGASSGWARYAPNCWIVASDDTPEILVGRVRPLIRDVDTVFVCEIDIHNNWGYLPRAVWDWITLHIKKMT